MTDVSRYRDRDFTLNVTDLGNVAWIVNGRLAAFLKASGHVPGQTIYAQDTRYETYFDTATAPNNKITYNQSLLSGQNSNKFNWLAMVSSSDVRGSFVSSWSLFSLNQAKADAP